MIRVELQERQSLPGQDMEHLRCGEIEMKRTGDILNPSTITEKKLD